MEFFRTINTKTEDNIIQDQLTLANLELITNDLFVIGNQNETEASIGGLWGEFTLSRAVVKGGVRFALVECPYGLAWTITAGLPPEKNAVVIHLTINRQTITEDFSEELNEFLDDQIDCLTQFFS